MAKGGEQLFAVVRLDWGGQDRVEELLEHPGSYVTVKEIVPTLEEAEHEVERLNVLNGGKGSVYFWQMTRYFPHGRSTLDPG
jgi:hypothetical protein